MIKKLLQLASRKQIGATNSINIQNNLNKVSLNPNLIYNRFASKKAGSSKSLQTSTFHKHQMVNGEKEQDEVCSELNELKKYFSQHEKDELDQTDEIFDQEESLTQLDLNQESESDLDEEFEQNMQNNNNGLKTKMNKNIFETKLEDCINRSLQQKNGVFSNGRSSADSQQDLAGLQEFSEKKVLKLSRKHKLQSTSLERKFGFNISSNPKERQSDLQRFVLKALQLLNVKQIQNFIMMIEYFKSKLTSQNFKKSQNSHEEFFMVQMYRFFTNNQAEELIDQFLKCDLIDINMSLFTNNVADYEKSLEIKNKYKLFDQFSKQSQPNGSLFILNELEQKYSNVKNQRSPQLQNEEEIENHIDELESDCIDKNNQIFLTNQQKLNIMSNDISGIQKNENQQFIQKSAQQITEIKQRNINNKEQLSQDKDTIKEQQLFQKVTIYEYEKTQSIQKIDSNQFDQLSCSESMYPFNQNHFSQKQENQNISSMNWNSSLLEDEFFPTSVSNNSIYNQSIKNNYDENFVLEPTSQSQQKIMQIGRHFENQFNHNINLIDDINNDRNLSSDNLPQIHFSSGQSSNIEMLKKDFSELLNLEFERTAIQTKKIDRIHNNKMALKSNYQHEIQTGDEVINLNQEESLIPQPFKQTNWVYMYQLPYDLNEVPNYTTYLKNFVESTFGDIEEIHFVNYKDFFEIDRVRQKEDQVHRDLRDSLQNQYIQTNITSNVSSEKPKKKELKANSKSSQKDNLDDLSDEELLENIYINNKINSDLCSRSIKRTEKILEKIQNKKELKYNKSYALIKFKDQKSKEKCLSQDIRLFGIQMFNQLFSFDDADYKRSLIITKIPWGINLQHLINKLNQSFKQQGLKNIKVSMENIDLKKVITKHYLHLKTNSFQDSINIVKMFQKSDIIIETQKLSCNHCYGSLKQGPQGFYEVTDRPVNNVELLERVNEKKVFEIWNIYKEQTGYLNSIRQNLTLNEDQDNIEIKVDELENYNKLDSEIMSSRFQSNVLHSSFSQVGFSKSSQYLSQKSSQYFSQVFNSNQGDYDNDIHERDEQEDIQKLIKDQKKD